MGALLSIGETIEADTVVLATGAAVPTDLQEFGVRIPQQTPISLLVRTKPFASDLRLVINTDPISIRPEPDGSIAMDAAWTEDQVVPSADSYVVKPETIERLLHEASRVLAGNPKLEAEWYGVGPKPVPGDGEPVLGRVESIPGLQVAFSHSGAAPGLIAGDLMAKENREGRASALLSSFRPARFNRAASASRP